MERLRTVVNASSGESRQEWGFEGFYGSFTAAVEHLADKIGFNSETLAGAVSEIREFRITIERMMNGQ